MRPLLHLKVTFTQTLPVNRPLVKNKKIQDPHWVAGFTSAEGSFLISINKNKASKYGLQVQLEFIITQHCKDEQLMVEFINFFDCGYLKKKFFSPLPPYPPPTHSVWGGAGGGGGGGGEGTSGAQ